MHGMIIEGREIALPVDIRTAGDLIADFVRAVRAYDRAAWDDAAEPDGDTRAALEAATARWGRWEAVLHHLVREGLLVEQARAQGK